MTGVSTAFQSRVMQQAEQLVAPPYMYNKLGGGGKPPNPPPPLDPPLLCIDQRLGECAVRIKRRHKDISSEK